jgi:transposase
LRESLKVVSRADVSLIAGVLTDKLQWHLPLYRQHQRMGEAGQDEDRILLANQR